jgi:hypothetical protein
MTTEQELERSRDRQRAINAFHRVFKSPDGEIVLKSLRAFFKMDRPAFERPPLGRPFDPIAGAIRDGNREVLLLIEHNLAQPVTGDADISEPKTKVVRG